MHNYLKRITAGIVACVMIFGMTVFASADEMTVSASEWAAEIPSMLSAGNYVEGEVVARVLYRNHRKPETEYVTRTVKIKIK